MKTLSEYREEKEKKKAAEGRKKHPKDNAWMDELEKQDIVAYSRPSGSTTWICYSPMEVRNHIRLHGARRRGLACDHCGTELVKGPPTYPGNLDNLDCPGCGAKETDTINDYA